MSWAPTIFCGQDRHWWEKAYNVPWSWWWEGEECGGLLLQIPHHQSSWCQWPFMRLPEHSSSCWCWLCCPVGLLPRPSGPGDVPPLAGPEAQLPVSTLKQFPMSSELSRQRLMKGERADVLLQKHWCYNTWNVIQKWLNQPLSPDLPSVSTGNATWSSFSKGKSNFELLSYALHQPHCTVFPSQISR